MSYFGENIGFCLLSGDGDVGVFGDFFVSFFGGFVCGFWVLKIMLVI